MYPFNSLSASAASKQFEPRSGPRPFVISLDQDQTRQNVGPDLGPDVEPTHETLVQHWFCVNHLFLAFCIFNIS